MVLADQTIKQMIDQGLLIIEPLGQYAIQSASVDCRLGNHFLVVEDNKTGLLNLETKIAYREITEESIIIPPHSFVLATTIEYLKLPNNMVAFVEGRSSIGRMGLFVQNAGWVDPGFRGNITLELYNANSLPIKLQAGRRICQLVFNFTDQEVQNPYQGKYQDQNKTVGSRVFQDKELTTQQPCHSVAQFIARR